ncbi:MAG: hypothetical protein KatS3mg099_276 [Candidatus Parcubacteria bacterium]|nr:MAG: hypothetical protein KatS3mg099_276 [Candidatus Parcubacteria bacterium]
MVSVRRVRQQKIRTPRQDKEKMKEVLLYILNKVGAKPNVGETVLHKLLYFIDFDYYEKYEETLMGATYLRNHHGPTACELRDILREMQEKKEIVAIKHKYFSYHQKKYLPLREPDLTKLSARELEHIDEVLARLADKNAAEIERYSHGDIPWQVTPPGEHIPYETVFYRDERYSVRDYDDEV